MPKNWAISSCVISDADYPARLCGQCRQILRGDEARQALPRPQLMGSVFQSKQFDAIGEFIANSSSMTPDQALCSDALSALRHSAQTNLTCGDPHSASSQLRIAARSEMSPRSIMWRAEIPPKAAFGFRTHP